MDSRLKLLGEKEPGLAYVEIRKLQAKRLELESLKEPEKMNPFEADLAELESALKAEVAQVVANIVQQANQNISSAYSNEGLLEQAKTIYRKEAGKLAQPFLMLQCFSTFKECLLNAAYSHEIESYSQRFAPIDSNIKSWQARIPVKFSPDLINKDERFPIERIGMLSGGVYFDKWLSDLLKHKPILFSSPEYADRIVDVYELYKKEHEQEHMAATQQVIEQEKAIEQAKQQPQPQGQVESISADELEAMREHQQGMDYGMKRLRELGRL